jgi:hypothetical protein
MPVPPVLLATPLLLLLLFFMQIVGSCLKRYPRDAAANASELQCQAPGSRPWLAAAVALGEQQLLQRLKKEALLIMLAATQVGLDHTCWQSAAAANKRCTSTPSLMSDQLWPEGPLC